MLSSESLINECSRATAYLRVLLGTKQQVSNGARRRRVTYSAVARLATSLARKCMPPMPWAHRSARLPAPHEPASRLCSLNRWLLSRKTSQNLTPRERERERERERRVHRVRVRERGWVGVAWITGWFKLGYRSVSSAPWLTTLFPSGLCAMLRTREEWPLSSAMQARSLPLHRTISFI